MIVGYGAPPAGMKSDDAMEEDGKSGDGGGGDSAKNPLQGEYVVRGAAGPGCAEQGLVWVFGAH